MTSYIVQVQKYKWLGLQFFQIGWENVYFIECILWEFLSKMVENSPMKNLKNESKRENKIANLIVNAVQTHAHSFSTHLCTLPLMIFTIFTEPTRKKKKKSQRLFCTCSEFCLLSLFDQTKIGFMPEQKRGIHSSHNLS